MGLTSSIKKFFSPLPKKKVDFRPSSFIKKDAEFIDDIPPVPSLPSGVVSSGFTPDTLKDAINDAKAVRATALSNAQNALTMAFDIHGIGKPAPSVYKPGFKIDILDEGTEIGDFDDDNTDDFVGAISGFDLNVPNKNNNSYNSITLTGSIPASSIQFNSFYNKMMPVISVSDPLPKVDKDIDDLLRAGLPQPKTPIDDLSGAVDKQPETRTGKIARVEFDVVIGRPQWSNQIHAIKNSFGKEIYLAGNQGIIRAAVKTFNEKLKEMYGGETPVFTIEGGTMFRTGLRDEPYTILDFHGLRFPMNGAKLVAIFSYSDKNDGQRDMEAIKRELELIGNCCQFYILGELELDETEEQITEIVIESFGYNNPHRMNVNKELFRIL